MGLKYLLGVHDLIVLADFHQRGAIHLGWRSGREWTARAGGGLGRRARTGRPADRVVPTSPHYRGARDRPPLRDSSCLFCDRRRLSRPGPPASVGCPSSGALCRRLCRHVLVGSPVVLSFPIGRVVPAWIAAIASEAAAPWTGTLGHISRCWSWRWLVLYVTAAPWTGTRGHVPRC